MRTALALILACTLICACGEEPVLPPAQPLRASPEAIEGLYGVRPGPHTVVSERGLVLPAREGRRAINLNLYYPEAKAAYPLLLFSHGNWSSRDSYDRVIEHWVSHGYAVIAPDHLDCCSMAGGILAAIRHGQYGMIEARVEDLGAVLDALGEVEALSEGLAGRYDPNRLAMTGHSFGAFSAQQFGGAAAFDPDRGAYFDAFDPRVKAILALSPPGPMFDNITEYSWDELRLPNLATTGTWDVQKGFWPIYRLHLTSFERARPGDNFALVVQGADHYLGNLICRLERDAAPQEDALAMVNSVSVAFLDTFLKGSAAGRRYLDGETLATTTSNFAVLERR